MNNYEHIARTITDQLKKGLTLVLVSIVSLQGSSPRHNGTKMVVSAEGKNYGTIGGSLLEATAINSSMLVITEKQSRFINIDLDGKDAYSKGMICGGKATLLLEYVTNTTENIRFFQHWQEAILSGDDYYFITYLKESNENIDIIGHGLLFKDGKYLGENKSRLEDIESLRNELHNISSTTKMTVNENQVIVDPMRKLNTLYCFGAGHVAVPTAQIAGLVGFRVVVIDDRSEFANRDRFPDANGIKVVKEFEHSMNELEVNKDSFIIILTRGHLYDRVVLEQALQTKAGYIGMISSRRKRDAIYGALMEKGVTQEELERVHSPIGLAIDAETPEEIAISIVAELILERSKQQAVK